MLSDAQQGHFATVVPIFGLEGHYRLCGEDVDLHERTCPGERR